MNFDKYNNFTVTFGDTEEIDDVKTKARCRIFYRGKNPNGSYITDEFAEQLISTVPYTPVKAIYDQEKEDYGTHGEKRSEGRIYGIVPENPNFSWEKYLDKDGIEREYATVDVYLFTGIYGEEAENIIGKSQSMELYVPSIDGHVEVFDGDSYFVFDKAVFLGLQALGDGVEPCFEGSAFFEKKDEKVSAIEKLLLKSREKTKQLNANYTKKEEHMDKRLEGKKDTFQLERMELRDAIAEKIREAANSDITVFFKAEYQSYVITEIWIDEEWRDYRVKFTIGENDEVTVDEIVEVKAFWLTDKESEVLKLVGDFTSLEKELAEEKATNSKNVQKVEELEGSLATLNVERDEFAKKIETLEKEKAALENEKKELAEYKLGVEKEEKEEIFTKFSAHLPNEVISKYRDNAENYTVEQLDKELSYEFCLAKPTIFTSKKGDSKGYVPKDDTVTGVSGIEAVLAKHAHKE